MIGSPQNLPLNAAKATGAAGPWRVLTQKQTNDAESKLADLKRQRAQLLVDATPEAPEVKEVDQQITELTNRLRSLSYSHF